MDDSTTPPTTLDHQVIDLTRSVPDKTIRIDRDYSQGDGITRFAVLYPPQLAGLITAEQFQNTITHINALLEDAEKLSWRTILDNVLECLTIYTWPMFFSTHYQRCIRRLLQFIQSENETLYHKHGLSLSNPVPSAFLFLEIKVYDP